MRNFFTVSIVTSGINGLMIYFVYLHCFIFVLKKILIQFFEEALPTLPLLETPQNNLATS